VRKCLNLVWRNFIGFVDDISHKFGWDEMEVYAFFELIFDESYGTIFEKDCK